MRYAARCTLPIIAAHNSSPLYSRLPTHTQARVQEFKLLSPTIDVTVPSPGSGPQRCSPKNPSPLTTSSKLDNDEFGPNPTKAPTQSDWTRPSENSTIPPTNHSEHDSNPLPCLIDISGAPPSNKNPRPQSSRSERAPISNLQPLSCCCNLY
jgi:hypothetical protein